MRILKYSKKIAFGIAIFFILAVLLLLVQGVLIEKNTIYTENFSLEKFEQIKTNMQYEEVETLIGEPFYKYQLSSNTEWWQYTKSGKIHPDLDEFIPERYIRVFFKDGKVSGIGDFIFD